MHWHWSWIKNREKWQQEFRVCSPDLTPSLFCPIVERPSAMGGPWAIGCSLCARDVAQGSSGVSSIFSRFKVRTMSMMQRSAIQAHCRTTYHRMSFAPGQSHESDTPPLLHGLTTGAIGLDGTVPRAERFVWAMQACDTFTSFRSFAKFVEASDLTSWAASEGVFRDASNKACAKMVASVAAVREEGNQRLARKCVRFAFAVDDHQQLLPVRCKVTVILPKVETHVFICGMVKEYGFDSEANARGIMAALKQFCKVRKGRRNHPRDHAGQADYFDQAMFDNIRKVAFSGAVEGQIIEMRAALIIAKSVNTRFSKL